MCQLFIPVTFEKALGVVGQNLLPCLDVFEGANFHQAGLHQSIFDRWGSTWICMVAWNAWVGEVKGTRIWLQRYAIMNCLTDFPTSLPELILVGEQTNEPSSTELVQIRTPAGISTLAHQPMPAPSIIELLYSVGYC